MLRIAITDDEDYYLDLLFDTLQKELLSRGLNDTVIDRFHSGEELLSNWTPGSYQLIFLDIYMHELSGIETARKIRESDRDVILVFCTTSNEFAAQSYEVSAGFYLQKPLSAETVSMMFDRIDVSRIESNQMIHFPDGAKCVLYDIAYTAYSNHTVTVYLSDGRSHALYMSQTEAEQLLLSHKNFCVINRGNIINFQAVKSLDRSNFIMKVPGDTVLPISRGKFKQVSAAYAEYKLYQMQ